MSVLLLDAQGRLGAASELSSWRQALSLPELDLGTELPVALARLAAQGRRDAAALQEALAGVLQGRLTRAEPPLASTPGRDAEHVHIEALQTAVGGAPGAVVLQRVPARSGTDAAVAAVQRRLAAVQALSGVGGWDYDTASGELAFTPEICRVIGRDPALPVLSIAGFLERVHEGNRALALALRDSIVAGFGPREATFRYRCDDGRMVWLEARLTHEAGPDGRPLRIVGTLRDVTESMQLQQQLEQQRKQMEELVVSRTVELAAARERAEAVAGVQGDFLVQSSHDIRTPLNAIVSLVHLIRRGPLDPEQLSRAMAVEQAARRLTEIVDDALERARRRAELPLPSWPPLPPAVPGRAPVAVPPAGPRPAPADAAEQLRRRHRGRRLLLAEDDAVSQAAMVSLLSDAGLRVDTADDGRQALEMAERGNHELFLLDLRMPRLSGVDAGRAIRALPGHRSTPILAISANAFAADRAACQAAGFNEFLAKPVEVDHLYATLLRWLDGAAPAPGAPAAETPAAAPHDGVVEALANAEGIDAQRGVASVGGKAAVYRRLLLVFTQTHGEDGPRVRQLLRDGLREGAAQLAHRVRGSAATLGLLDVELAAAELEQAIEVPLEIATIEQRGQVLEQALATTLRQLQAVLAG